MNSRARSLPRTHNDLRPDFRENCDRCAYVPDLPGCAAAGSTLEETSEFIRGAAEMHLETMRQDGDPIPAPTTVTGYVAVPA